MASEATHPPSWFETALWASSPGGLINLAQLMLGTRSTLILSPSKDEGGPDATREWRIALPDQTASRYLFYARHHAIAMEHHLVEEIGNDAGMVRDNADLVADLRTRADAVR